MDTQTTPGRYGPYGGRYVPETLMSELEKLTTAYEHFSHDPDFIAELDGLLKGYAGRPSLLYLAQRMTDDLGGARIWLKREDLNHTGSHKINNVLGQALLAKRMGKTRVIAETGAGQHGVATATAAALLGLECEVFMGEEDTRRQALNVYRMELLGATVHPVTSGTMTLKDAVNETMREWTNRLDDTLYVLGSVMGPHPFPIMVRDFQAVIGREVRAQMQDAIGKLPDVAVACVGGGSNSMGLFYDFIGSHSVQLIGCEAAGLGVDSGRHAATIAAGTPGVFHGMKSYFCQDDDGQIAPVYSISAGLDYPGIGPEHAWLHDTGRAQYVPITDEQAVEAFEYLARTEGIICAIESAHAVAHVRNIAAQFRPDQDIVICLSGRGDKDVAAIARYRGREIDEPLIDHAPAAAPFIGQPAALTSGGKTPLPVPDTGLQVIPPNTSSDYTMSNTTQRPIAGAFDHGKAFIAFVTVGDPSIAKTAEYVEALVDGGADLIELGIPFSDPIAEGPVIQEADQRALNADTDLDTVFGLAADLNRRVDVPLVFLTYLNPVFHTGYKRFFERCQAAGISGVIIPDLPFEEQGELLVIAQASGVDVITLVAPTSADRIERIAKSARGFVYAVSSMGVTGVRNQITTDIDAMVAAIKQHTDIPVAVGFGISTPEQATAMAAVSDGVIVGSRIVKIIAEHPQDAAPYLRDYAASMKAAIS